MRYILFTAVIYYYISIDDCSNTVITVCCVIQRIDIVSHRPAIQWQTIDVRQDDR